MTNTDVLIIAYNRPKFTSATLDTVLRDSAPYRLWIWQNGENPEVAAIVNSVEAHALVARVRRSPENVGLREPTNWLWRESQAPFLAKVDDDCLMPAGWCERLLAAHEASDRFGILGSWPFRAEDLRPELMEAKSITEGGQKIMLNPWVGGSGYVMKRACVDRCGLLRENEGFTRYCMRVARAGWYNGWPLPMIVMDHMDDPRSEHTVFKSDEDVVNFRGLTVGRRGISTLDALTARVKEAALELQTCSSDWRDYIGWRAKTKRILRRITR